MEVETISQAISAYRSITATPEFKEKKHKGKNTQVGDRFSVLTVYQVMLRGIDHQLN